MTYYEDLSPYDYGPDGEGDLNVGWLEAGHSFPTEAPEPLLVSALLRCARRAERQWLGYHDCDLCSGDIQPQLRPLRLGGRRYFLGNGEIRVRSADHGWLTAPTLVAHYVAAHHYAPPRPFTEAVIETARRLPTLQTDVIRKIATMTPLDRFDVCVKLLGICDASEHDWFAPSLEKLRAMRYAVDPALWKQPGADFQELCDATDLPLLPAEWPMGRLHAAMWTAMSIVRAGDSKMFDEDTVDLTADLIEVLLEGPIELSTVLPLLE